MYIPRAEDPDEALAAAIAAAVKAEAAKAAEEAKAAAIAEAKAAMAKVPVGEIVGAGEFASNFHRGLGVHTVVAENTPGATSPRSCRCSCFPLRRQCGYMVVQA
jgi:membrane protein involved in colicin uptake